MIQLRCVVVGGETVSTELHQQVKEFQKLYGYGLLVAGFIVSGGLADWGVVEPLPMIDQ